MKINMQCPICKSEKICGCKTTGIIIIVLLAMVGGYFLLRGDYRSPTPAPAQTSTIVPKETEQPTETLPTTQAPAAKATELSVSATEFSFSPASISVKAGEKVKITFKNNGRAPHNFILAGLGLGTKTISSGQTEAIEFTAPSSGTYNFFCSIPGHQASGMAGVLKIE